MAMGRTHRLLVAQHLINAAGLLYSSYPSVVALAPTPVALKVDFTSAPLAIDRPDPTFSWSVAGADGQRGVLTKGFTLTVTELSPAGQPVLGRTWTRMERTNRTTFVDLPEGVQLTSDTTYNWSVAIQPGGASAVSSFSTGLLSTTDWVPSIWVTAPEVGWPGYRNNPAQWPSGAQATQMRQAFRLPPGDVTRARLFVALPGYGQVLVNGHAVDGEAGTRSWSQYDIRVLYHTYDVTATLTAAAENVIGLHVGRGWYGGPSGGPRKKNQWLKWSFGPPAVRAVLRATVCAPAGAGSSSSRSCALFTFGTDVSWDQSPGPVVMDDEYKGETFDRRLETPGWAAPGFVPKQEQHWTKALAGANSSSFLLQHSKLSSAAFPPIEVMHRLTASRMWQPRPGVFVFDFSQNIAGWCKLKIKGPAGLAVQLRHSELLRHPGLSDEPGPLDGTIGIRECTSCANATDIYILRGDESGETFEPTFSQHGFRYVEMTFHGVGSIIAPTLDMLEAVAIRSSVAQTGAVGFDDPLMNRIQHNTLWGQADNLMMVPTDCDNRAERQGWTGDAALTADEAAFNYDMGAFFQNWARLLNDDSPNGALGCFVPHSPLSVGGAQMNYAGKGFAPANKSCDASWASAFPSTVYATMRTEGDISIARRNWEGLKRFIDNEVHRATQNESLGLRFMFTEFGDWISQPGPVPGGSDISASGQQLSAFSFVKDLGHFVEIAEALGRDADAAHYRTLLHRFQAEWHQLYFSNGSYIAGYEKGTYNATTGNFTPGSAMGRGGQPSNSVGVWLDGAPAGARESALKALVADVLEHKNHTSCGIISWRFQLEALSAHGYTDVAYALLTQKTYPSLGFEILNKLEPATTWWEQWDALPSSGGMNSRNHIMFAGPLGWMYTYGAGLQQAPHSIGFEHVIFAPPGKLIEMAANNISLNGNISAPLRFATASKTTLRGTIGIRWYLPPPPAPPYKSCFADVPPASTADCGPGGCVSTAVLQCPNHLLNPIEGVMIATYGNGTGNCSGGLVPGGCSYNLSGTLSRLCAGQHSCNVHCDNSKATCTIGSGRNATVLNLTRLAPAAHSSGSSSGAWRCSENSANNKLSVQVICPSPIITGTVLHVDVALPPTCDAVTKLPLLGSDPAMLVISEGGRVVWSNGSYVSGVNGVVGAEVDRLADAVAIAHGSGEYHFVRTG